MLIVVVRLVPVVTLLSLCLCVEISTLIEADQTNKCSRQGYMEKACCLTSDVSNTVCIRLNMSSRREGKYY